MWVGCLWFRWWWPPLGQGHSPPHLFHPRTPINSPLGILCYCVYRTSTSWDHSYFRIDRLWVLNGGEGDGHGEWERKHWWVLCCLIQDFFIAKFRFRWRQWLLFIYVAALSLADVKTIDLRLEWHFPYFHLLICRYNVDFIKRIKEEIDKNCTGTLVHLLYEINGRLMDAFGKDSLCHWTCPLTILHLFLQYVDTKGQQLAGRKCRHSPGQMWNHRKESVICQWSDIRIAHVRTERECCHLCQRVKVSLSNLIGETGEKVIHWLDLTI